MNNKNRLLTAFAIAVMLMALFAAATMISRLLDHLLEPWNFIANGAMFLALVTYGIYGLISAFQDDKEAHDPDCRCREKGVENE
jgi:hypothetical protein|nr:MAG TPA: Putative manganese efflux pump [Caudoviricetes sp.]